MEPPFACVLKSIDPAAKITVFSLPKGYQKTDRFCKFTAIYFCCAPILFAQSTLVMKSAKVLIVEDELLIAGSIRRYLEQQGYEVVGTATSVATAQRLYENARPDLALLDIRLQGEKSGLDMARFIQQQARPIPFIFLTSQFDKQTLEAAKSTYPAGYLSKPIQRASLLSTIEIALHNHERSSSMDADIKLVERSKHYIVPVSEILYLQSEHIYVRVYLRTGQEILQRGSLGDLLRQLPGKQFLQVHRSFVVNTRMVSRYDQDFLFVDEVAIPVSRSRKKALERVITQDRS